MFDKIVSAAADYDVVLEPDQNTPEWWAGAPSALLTAEGEFFLAARMREGESGVVGDHSEVGDVVVEPLHLEQDHTQEARAFRDFSPGQGFERLAIG